MSEEIERRLEQSFDQEGVAQAATSAVNAAAERLSIAQQASYRTIFSTLERFEKAVGGPDVCSFAVHAGQSLALHLRNTIASSETESLWWEDPDKKEAVKAKILKSVSGLIDNWDFVLKSPLIPGLGWAIDSQMRAEAMAGEIDRQEEGQPTGR